MFNLVVVMMSLFISCSHHSSLQAQTKAQEIHRQKSDLGVWRVERNEIEVIAKEGLPLPEEIELIGPEGKSQVLSRNNKMKFNLSNWPLVGSWKAKISGKIYPVLPHRDFLNKYLSVQTKDFGAKYDGHKLSLKLWSPTANKVRVEIHPVGRAPEWHDLQSSQKGVWQLELNGKHYELAQYQLEIKAYGSVLRGLDPYALSMASFKPGGSDPIGKGIISAKLNRNLKPHKGLRNLSSPTEFIGYELHVRDATIADSRIPYQLKGTYLGLEYVIDEITELGVTHVQFHPLQNFYTVDEQDRSFQDDSKKSHQINYNWGYDPHHFFTPEGWFSTDAKNPLKRIDELKSMVESLHRNDIGVIVDVVYNHLYDERTLENVAPGCYLRRDPQGNISYHSGAGASLESRNLMTRKLIIDSLVYWRDQFKVDGFRFDLMGFLDHDTMIAIREAMGEEIILYGEAWEFTDLPHSVATTKSQLPERANLSAFNDSSRDSYTGWMATKGFVQGMAHDRPKVLSGIIGGIDSYPRKPYLSQDRYHFFAKEPSWTLNFLTIHDGFTLWDKINLTVDATEKEREKKVMQAFAMLMTSQGKIILHAGSERGRSKPLTANDPNPDRAHSSDEVNTENGVRSFHENSYRSSDITNQILWDEKLKKSDLYHYVKNLILLRRQNSAFRYSSSQNIVQGLEFKESLFDMKAPTDPKGPFTKFSDLKSLTLSFHSAPKGLKGKSAYIVGEVHKKEQNPKNNPYKVQFNQSGLGEFYFDKTALESFELSAWSDPDALQIKLTTNPGQWELPEGIYSSLGNNTIDPTYVLENPKKPGHGILSLDLSQLNHSPGRSFGKHKAFFAYKLNNQLEPNKSSPWKEFLVIHNGENSAGEVPLDPGKSPWQVLVDGERASLNPLKNSAVKILPSKVKVPKNSSVILAR